MGSIKHKHIGMPANHDGKHLRSSLLSLCARGCGMEMGCAGDSACQVQAWRAHMEDSKRNAVSKRKAEFFLPRGGHRKLDTPITNAPYLWFLESITESESEIPAIGSKNGFGGLRHCR